MLLNLRCNETVAKFANAAGVGTANHLRLSAQAKPKAGGGACTSIAFRTGVSYPSSAKVACRCKDGPLWFGPLCKPDRFVSKRTRGTSLFTIVLCHGQMCAIALQQRTDLIVSPYAIADPCNDRLEQVLLVTWQGLLCVWVISSLQDMPQVRPSKRR